tara:strand:- start:266 stop:883 length:618 start_codon:yes stop_codon:yes gene_type:complete
MAKSKAAMAEEARKKKIRETSKEGVMSFFNKYIAGRKTKVKAENKTNANNRVANKTKTMSEKNAVQLSKIAKNSKSVGSSQTDSQMSAKARKDAIAKLMKRVNTPTPKGVSQGSSASKSPKSSLGYPKVSQGSKTAAGKTGYPKVSQGSTTSKKRKPAIVSKAALEKSGLSLRDYLNMKQGKTRKDYKDVKMAASRKRRARGATT